MTDLLKDIQSNGQVALGKMIEGNADELQAWSGQTVVRILSALPDVKGQVAIIREAFRYLQGEDHFEKEEEGSLGKKITEDHTKLFDSFAEIIENYLNQKDELHHQLKPIDHMTAEVTEKLN